MTIVRQFADAEAIWDGTALHGPDLLAIWEPATNNGLTDAADYCWGQAGTKWAAHTALSAGILALCSGKRRPADSFARGSGDE